MLVRVTDFVLVAVILLSHKFHMNPDNLATPLAASIGDVVSLSVLSFIASLLFENLGNLLRKIVGVVKKFNKENTLVFSYTCLGHVSIDRRLLPFVTFVGGRCTVQQVYSASIEIWMDTSPFGSVYQRVNQMI